VQREGVHEHQELTDAPASTALATLVCFVLVQRATGRHAFCSRYDFGPWPLLPGAEPCDAAAAACCGSGALMLNGFLFDEMEPAAVVRLVETAASCSTAVVFDPGAFQACLAQGVDSSSGSHASRPSLSRPSGHASAVTRQDIMAHTARRRAPVWDAAARRGA
jgi:hypothetical protein